MSKSESLCAVLLIVMVCGALVSGFALSHQDLTIANLRRNAVEHGYAKYELDETTGKIEFKWKEKE